MLDAQTGISITAPAVKVKLSHEDTSDISGVFPRHIKGCVPVLESVE